MSNDHVVEKEIDTPIGGSQDERPKQSKLKIIGRWIAVLPSWLGGFAVSFLLVKLFFDMGTSFAGDPSHGGWADITRYIFAPLGAAFLAVYWGARVAPSHRKVVALILFGLTIVANWMQFRGNMFLLGDGSERAEPFGWSVLMFIAILIGAGYITYKFFKEGDAYKIN